MGNCLRRLTQGPSKPVETVKPCSENVQRHDGFQTAPPGHEQNCSNASSNGQQEKADEEERRVGFSTISDGYPALTNGYKNTETDGIDSSGINQFSYNVLKNATHKFDSKNLIGEGGFGEVYKGWIDSYTMTAAKPGYGLPEAVKKLRKEGAQGHSEWRTELTLLSQFKLPNIVKLLGYCLQGDNHLLVYEYMERVSLERYLLQESSRQITWSERIKAVAGAAKGLAYLHTLPKPVIHRDLKSSNIILGPDFEAKLSDFGWAKFGPQSGNTHVSTRVLGTRGYLAPEYFATGHLTLMTDIYSFGVVLLEVFSGTEAIKKHTGKAMGDLASWAKPLLRSKTEVHRIIDRKLRHKIQIDEAYKFAHIILRCLDSDPKRRPAMTEVVVALEKVQQRTIIEKVTLELLRSPSFSSTSYRL